MINKLTKQPATIKDFTKIVTWIYIEEVLYAKDYKRFLTWMDGQTTPPDGVFSWDLKRFLERDLEWKD